MTTSYGDFAYDPATRILRGLLLPFGEQSRVSISGAEPMMFGAASIDLPRDPSVITLNRNHDRHDPVGRAILLEKRAAGVYAEFRIADTDEGDAYLRDQRNTLRKLSAEVAGIVRSGARALRSKLTGAALVDEGAFASAALFALDDTVTVAGYEYPAESESSSSWSETRSDGSAHESVTTTVEEAEDLGDGTARITRTTTTVTTITEAGAAPAEDTEEEESEALMGTNIVPGTAVTPTPSLNGLFAAIAHNDPDQLRAYRGAGELFALKTLQHSGPTTLTVGADTQEAGYLGELWTRAPYQRRIVPLLGQEALTSYEMHGWRWAADKSPEMGDYPGNTVEVASNDLDTEPVTVTASRLAGAHRLDRRFRDFNDQAVVASYLVHQAEDYKRKTDAKALAAIIAAGTATVPGTVPTGIAKGLAAIVDGALGVIATENRPAYSLVSPELWRDIILTPKDDVLAFLNAGFGLEEGDVAGFRIQPAAVGVGKVVTAAKEALTFYELGETPIRIEGVAPGNGADDVAVFGYWATLTNNAAAIRTVTVAP